MAKAPLTVTVITDTHYYAKSTGISGAAYETANAKSQMPLQYSEEILDAAFRQIKADKRTDIVLLSGDTTSNGEYDSHKEFIEMLRGLKAAGKRVYVITATHDYQDDGQTNSYVGDEKVKIPAAKREELYEMYREFGPDEAISVHRDSMSYVVQLQEGYRLFAINDDRNLTGKSGISEDCYKWLCEQAEDARKNKQFILAMTHHPLIAPSPVYALIGKNDMHGDFDIRREQYADMGIQFMLTGHTHIHHIDKVESKRGNTLYTISTAATIGYPAPIRTVVVDEAAGIVSTTTDLVTEKVDFDLKGKSLQDYLKNQMVGIVRDMVKAAAGDTHKFADMATSISIKKKLIYKIGWLVKPVAKLLNKLTIGTVAKWTKKETGLSPEEYADIADRPVVDFIVDMVTNLYGGEDLYSPDDAEYKITMGLLSILDSVFGALHIKVRKLLKVSDSLCDFVEPLLHNTGIPSYNAVLPILPYYAEGEQAPPKKAPEEKPARKKSKKGVPIVIIGILALIILLIPLLLALAIGFIVNQVRYGRFMK